MKKITLLGSTGSIGTQTLDVIGLNPEKFTVQHLVAGNNADLLIKQALEYKPKSVVINNTHIEKVKDALSGTGVEVLDENHTDEIAGVNVDIVVAGITGSAGLSPVLSAIKSGNDIALANKESLVCGGDMVMELAGIKGVNIIPVDSEHSAIFQVLSDNKQGLEKIILTASGGAFLNRDKDFIQNAKLSDALNHPNWDMGKKVTIDSAGLMNKGLEVIEACYLFNESVDKIDVVIHPQSIIHSMVSYVDGSTLAQMGQPNMKTPIAYALSYPDRVDSGIKPLNFGELGDLTFEKPDLERFPALKLCIGAMKAGGGKTAVLNGANEVAVDTFINGNIVFGDIAKVVEKMLENIDSKTPKTIDEFNELNSEVVAKTAEYIKAM